VETIFVILLGSYVLIKLVLFVGVYIATKEVERKALERKKQYEVDNRVVELKTLLSDYEKRKKHLEGEKTAYSARRNVFLD
jgi:flagellar biosynthesis/type III secretory pathway M-ring protein FliF/YscJ